jgi:hypothetical protein
MASQAHGERGAEPKAEIVSPTGPFELKGPRVTALLIFTQLPGVLAYTIPLPLLAQMALALFLGFALSPKDRTAKG